MTIQSQLLLATELKKKADDVAIEMKQAAVVSTEAINGKLTDLKDTIVANGQTPRR